MDITLLAQFVFNFVFENKDLDHVLRIRELLEIVRTFLDDADAIFLEIAGGHYESAKKALVAAQRSQTVDNRRMEVLGVIGHLRDTYTFVQTYRDRSSTADKWIPNRKKQKLLYCYRNQSNLALLIAALYKVVGETNNVSDWMQTATHSLMVYQEVSGKNDDNLRKIVDEMKARSSLQEVLRLMNLPPDQVEAELQWKLDYGFETRKELLGVPPAKEVESPTLKFDADYVDKHEQDPIDVDMHTRLGIDALDQKRYSEAEAHFQQALKLDPSGVNAVWILFFLANVYLPQRRYSEAEAHLQQALKLNRNSPDVHLMLGVIDRAQKRYSEAETHLQQVLKLDPNFAQTYCALGYIALDQKRYSEAQARFQQALKLDPNSNEAHEGLTSCTKHL